MQSGQLGGQLGQHSAPPLSSSPKPAAIQAWCWAFPAISLTWNIKPGPAAQTLMSCARNLTLSTKPLPDGVFLNLHFCFVNPLLWNRHSWPALYRIKSQCSWSRCLWLSGSSRVIPCHRSYCLWLSHCLGPVVFSSISTQVFLSAFLLGEPFAGSVPTHCSRQVCVFLCFKLPLESLFVGSSKCFQ